MYCFSPSQSIAAPRRRHRSTVGMDGEKQARWFYRVPVSDTIEQALDLSHGGRPVLHAKPGGEVVGIVELAVDPFEERLYRRWKPVWGLR